MSEHIEGPRLEELIELVQELQVAKKPYRVIKRILEEQHGLGDFQARRVIEKTMERWKQTPEVHDERKARHIEYLTRFADRCVEKNHLATAARVMVEVGKIEGVYDPTTIRIVDDHDDPERKRLRDLIAKYEGEKK